MAEDTIYGLRSLALTHVAHVVVALLAVYTSCLQDVHSYIFIHIPGTNVCSPFSIFTDLARYNMREKTDHVQGTLVWSAHCVISRPHQVLIKYIGLSLKLLESIGMRNTPVDVACCVAYHQPRHHNPYGVDEPKVEVEVQWFRSGVYKACKHHIQS